MQPALFNLHEGSIQKSEAHRIAKLSHFLSQGPRLLLQLRRRQCLSLFLQPSVFSLVWSRFLVSYTQFLWSTGAPFWVVSIWAMPKKSQFCKFGWRSRAIGQSGWFFLHHDTSWSGISCQSLALGLTSWVFTRDCSETCHGPANSCLFWWCVWNRVHPQCMGRMMIDQWGFPRDLFIFFSWHNS